MPQRDVRFVLDANVDGPRLHAGALASLAFLAFLLLLPVAQCWAPAGAARALAESDLSIEEVDLTFEGDLRILTAVHAAYELSRPGTQLELLIARSLELNAASFGSGRFVFWEGSADLPAAQLDALAAHEVAHDVLLHSLRAQDAAALVKFFAEVLSLFGRADQRGQENIQSWLATVTMPRYSRVQELEADAYAVGLLGEMGHADSSGIFVALLETLYARYGDTGGGFTDSHPATTARIERITGRPFQNR